MSLVAISLVMCLLMSFGYFLIGLFLTIKFGELFIYSEYKSSVRYGYDQKIVFPFFS